MPWETRRPRQFDVSTNLTALPYRGSAISDHSSSQSST